MMDKTDKLIKQFGKVTTPSVVPIADDILIPNHSGITGNKDAMNKLTLQKVTDNGATTTNDITQRSAARINFNNTDNSKTAYIKASSTAGNGLLIFATAGTANYFMFESGSTKVSTDSTETTSAKFELVSTTKGFLPPRMTTTQKNAIGSPAEGLIVYDLTLHKLCVYTGAAWETITSA